MALLRTTKTSFYSLALQQSARRKAIAQAAIDRSDALRSAMTSNIQTFTAGQVQLSELMLRSKSQTATQAKTSTVLNKLV